MWKKYKDTIILLLSLIAIFQLYLYTTFPAFKTDDSPETITSTYTLGIQHPPGYPLDTLTGKIFTLIPSGNLMYRSNFTALFFHILSSMLIFFFVLNCFASEKEPEPRDKYFAVLSSLLYFLCFTPFSQALSAKGSIYTINAFFTVLFFFALFKIPESKKYAYFSAFIYGLSMGNHWQSMAVIFPAMLFYLIMKRKYVKFNIIIKGLVFFLLGASVYLFVFIRSWNAPVFAWGDIRTIKDLFWLIGREQYRFAESTHSIADTLRLLWFYLGNILVNEYIFYGALLFIPGAYFLIKKQKFEGAAISMAYLCILAGIVLISTPKPTIEWVIKPYFTSSYIFISVLVAACILGLIGLMKKSTEKSQNNISLAVIAAVVILSLFHMPDYSRNFIGYDYADNIIKTLPEDSLFIAEGDLNINGTLYKQLVEKKELLVISPLLLEYDWYRLQTAKNYYGKIIMTPKAGNGVEDLHNIIMANKSKRIYYSNSYTAEWQRLGFAPMGIINRVLTGQKDKTAANGNYFQMYSYRGIIGDKVNYDESTDLLAVKHYSWSFITLAEMLKNSGSYAAAVKLYKYSQVFEPKDTTLARIGLCYYNMKDMQNAETFWKEAIELNPQASYAYSSLAAVYLNRGETAKAIEYVDNALKYDSNNINAVQLKIIINKRQSVTQ